MVKLFVSLAVLSTATCTNLYAQIAPIQPDRPGESESTTIVPKNYIQIETGFLVEKESATSKNYDHPSVLWKYGLNEKLEFRLITALASQTKNHQTITGLKPLTAGFKVNLWKQKGLMPTGSFIGQLTTSNMGSKVFQTTFIAPSFRFLMQHKFGKVAIGYNLGVEWDGETPEPTYIYTFTEVTAVTKKVNCFVELYGFAPSLSQAYHSVDGGLTYLLSKNLVADISGGFGLTHNAPDNYVSLGFSYRFNTVGGNLKKGTHATMHLQNLAPVLTHHS